MAMKWFLSSVPSPINHTPRNTPPMSAASRSSLFVGAGTTRVIRQRQPMFVTVQQAIAQFLPY